MTSERTYWEPDAETMTVSALSAHQLDRLKSLLHLAYERSPYYRQSFDAARIVPSNIDNLETFAARVPFISKEIILEAQLINPPYGGLLTVSPADLARIYVGPGPLYMPLTDEDLDGMTNTAALGMWCAGIRSHDIADVTQNYHWVMAGTVVDATFRKLGCAVVPGGIGNTKMHLEAMQKLGITAMSAFPTYFVHLAETAKEMGIDIRKDLSLRVAMIGGELKPKEALAELEEQFGMKVREIYGTADCGQVAFECDAKAGMHLVPHFIVEILDPVTHRPVPKGDGGEIVVTVLYRKGMPIIRYRTGDIVAFVSHGSCTCGRHTPRLGPIVGRVGDIPRVKGMFIVPKQIENALYAFKGLGRFQMIIDRQEVSDTLSLRIVAAEGVDRSGIKAEVIKAVRDAIRIGAEVEFVDALPEDAPASVDKRKV